MYLQYLFYQFYVVRYRNAQMCEVSDIDEWMELHYGMSDDEESEDP